jgi:hypothetical protein
VLIILVWICGARGVYRVFLRKPEGKRPLGRPRRKLVNNIRMNLWVDCVYIVWWGNRMERAHWGDLGVEVWIIVGWICWEMTVYRVLGETAGKETTGET